jgi:hypothetical protein
MPLDVVASSPVRPTAETAANAEIPHQPERLEASSADFDLAVRVALAPLESISRAHAGAPRRSPAPGSRSTPRPRRW